MGILPDHEPVLTVIKEGTIVVVDPEGNRLSFEVTDGFISSIRTSSPSRSSVEPT